MQPQIGILTLLIVSMDAKHMKLKHAERDARYASVRINRLRLGFRRLLPIHVQIKIQ